MGGEAMQVDNAVIHLYPASPYIVKAGLNLRNGKKIAFRFALKDLEACRSLVERHYYNLPVKVITHS